MRQGMRRIKPRPVHRHNRLKLYMLVFAGTGALIVYVAAHVFILSLEGRIRSMQEDNERLQVMNEQLRIEVTELRKGVRIKAIAEDNLGMIVPDGAPERLF